MTKTISHYFLNQLRIFHKKVNQNDLVNLSLIIDSECLTMPRRDEVDMPAWTNFDIRKSDKITKYRKFVH